MGSHRQGVLIGNTTCHHDPSCNEIGMGNPFGLKIKSIGEGEDLFVAEFGFKQDMEWVLGDSSWMVGKHALIL